MGEAEGPACPQTHVGETQRRLFVNVVHPDNDDSTALEKSVPAVKMRTIIGMGTCRSQVELVEDLDNASLASLQVDAELHLHTHKAGINCGLILPATSIVSASPF